MSHFSSPSARFFAGLGFVLGAASAASAQDLLVYDDQLRSGFQNWSWATHNLAFSAQSHTPPNSIQMQPDNWEGLYFHSDQGYDVADFLELRFWVKGQSSGGQLLQLLIQSNGTTRANVNLEGFVTGGISGTTWREGVVSFAAIGLSTGSFNELTLAADSQTAPDQAPVLFDDIRFVGDPTPPGPVSIAVDPALDRRAISAFVYGVNFASPAQLADVGYTLNRWGGNRTTRYNWQLDVDNSAFDWFYQNYTGPGDPGELPVGSGADEFVLSTRTAGAEAILTVPTIGRTSGPDRVRRWAFSVADYGAQLQTECTYFGSNPDDWPDWCNNDAGNGRCSTGPNCVGGRIVGNDPNEVSIPIATSFVTNWTAFVASRVGPSHSGGVRYIALDNEPMLWNSTHADIHPAAPTYDEVWNRGRTIAQALKAQNPQVQILGPDTWGWCDLWTSAADVGGVGDDCTDGPDRQAHNGAPFVSWYLQQVCAHLGSTGVRLVDHLDVHYYPQSGEAFGGESYAGIRLQSIRELYDPTYVSQSWIPGAPRLLPRLREWIAASCPGTKLAVTEYAWGADDAPSGALAQAEVLAIFGREGVDLATRWVVPASGSKTEEAFELYLDYDGVGGQVRGENVRAVSSDIATVGSYAVRGGDDRLFVLLFNKDDEPRATTVTFAAPVTGPAALYRFTPTVALGAAGTLPVVGGVMAATLPARSATLAIVKVVSNLIFKDGVESGSTWAWSAVSP